MPLRSGKPCRPSSPIQSLLSLCRTLGIVINEKKSDLVPSQTAKYLGMTIDTEGGKVFPSLVRVEKFLTVAESFCAMDAAPAQLWQVILDHLASLEMLVPHGRFRMRSLQWHLKAHWSPETDPPSLPVPLPQEARRDLAWWMVWDHLLMGIRFGTPALDLHLYSGASCSGWGAHLLDQNVSGCVVGPEVAAHQSSRDEGSVPGPPVVSRRCHRSPCDSDVRQLNGRGVRQQARFPVPYALWPAAFGDGRRVSTSISMRGIFQDRLTSWQISSAVAGKL